ncbi:polysaccharide pyruvyl transferase CsaB [Acidaminobacter hydrogenoformans]|uniref:Polysaccharide pyruvyl transferase CsaB n=1 Tax=Acidaminobacter hydrogenoformans DSM 2784 TaxID=1120920 RepID=A0A1G5S307_9FIRM|nr:polysaccharide pyruvyl transferase CsaB [Acidaminobacter hydrogenoformans]SCZ80782.1 polysaccharide pyruvyl transferase CsaB [Acidaminobacter hydrogenoformans DSM 2784]
MSRHNLLISGYYGFGNIGDEAILDTMVKRIQSAVPEAELTVLSANPERTRSLYGIRAVERARPLKVLRAVWSCDTLISGGGSLIQDVTGRLSIHYYLMILMAASLLGKKVMVYSQGIGPIQKPVNRVLTKWVLNRADIITVREENSKKDLIQMGIRSEKLFVTADPVIDMACPGKALGENLLKAAGLNENSTQKRVAFALRSKDFREQGAYDALCEVVNALLRERCAVIFVPFHFSEDLEVIRRLKVDFGDKIYTLVERHAIQEILSVIHSMDLLVGVRLHALIFSAVAGTPLLALSYDPKIDYFMKAIGQSTFGPVNAFSPETLTQEILFRLEKTETDRAALISAVEDLKTRLDINERELVKLLGGK